MSIASGHQQSVSKYHTSRPSEFGAVVLCAGRHAAEVLDILSARGDAIHGCLDAAIPIGTEIYPCVRVVGRDDAINDLVSAGCDTVYLAAR